MAVRDWNRGQVAVVWGALILLSIWIAVALFLGDGSGGWRSWVPIWILTLGLLSLPGFVVTWRWMGRDRKGLDAQPIGIGDTTNPLSEGHRRSSSQGSQWIVGLAITAAAGVYTATGDAGVAVVLLAKTLAYVAVVLGVVTLLLGWSQRTRSYMPIAMAVTAMLVSLGYGLRNGPPPIQPALQGEAIDSSTERDPRIKRLRERLQVLSDSQARDTTRRPDDP